mmetsp:Transcript_31540/g.60093  ORF Transcript_31540/g.60093 Transcript_31540/m.60093 type:complete len:424 (-) Transcript_31540:454-1725(-)
MMIPLPPSFHEFAWYSLRNPIIENVQSLVTYQRCPRERHPFNHAFDSPQISHKVSHSKESNHVRQNTPAPIDDIHRIPIQILARNRQILRIIQANLPSKLQRRLHVRKAHPKHPLFRRSRKRIMNRCQNQHLSLGAIAIFSRSVGIVPTDLSGIFAHFILIIGITRLGVPKLGIGRFGHDPSISLLNILRIHVQSTDGILPGMFHEVAILQALHTQGIHHGNLIFPEFIPGNLTIQSPIRPCRSLAEVDPPASEGDSRGSGGIEEGAAEDGVAFAIGEPGGDGGGEGGYSAAGEAEDALAVVYGEVGREAFEREDGGGAGVGCVVPRDGSPSQTGIGPLRNDHAIGIHNRLQTIHRLPQTPRLNDAKSRSLPQPRPLQKGAGLGSLPRSVQNVFSAHYFGELGWQFLLRFGELPWQWRVLLWF